MLLILSQRIDYKSEYKDVPFKLYHFPKSYRSQIKAGDKFIYYQGDRYKKENRYYYGCGIVGDIISSDDGRHYYAEIINGVKFPNKVPIYNPSGGFFESIGYENVREKPNPPWQRSIRKISDSAFKKILSFSKLDLSVQNLLLYSVAKESMTKYDKKLLIPLSAKLKESEAEYILEHAAEDEIENLLLQLDGSGSIEINRVLQKVRKASRKTITTLKEIYNYTCQICGSNHKEKYGVNVVEAHHIDYFADSLNNQPNNIVILCPTHHRLVHSGNATFIRPNCYFKYKNGYEEKLKINKHL
ncbi:HNH endonuclease signature motif containing protein [Evansella clarkii]|uniref:HNH endonuclease signature motif containing protein n=1 Tax=Evansella clarkii TaxID=79879 RepID=UPI000B44CE1D|nr:HNH endonuclease signature motif containing protein [Evansella clarkii]